LWSTNFLAREKIERRTNAYLNQTDAILERVRKLLLQRTPEADKKHACSAGIDSRNKLTLLTRRQRTKN
jgi:hypothetical protein